MTERTPRRTIPRVAGWILSLLRGLVCVVLAVLGGFLVTLAIVVARARAGSYVYDLRDMVALRWETAPILAGLAAGIWFGVRDPRALWRATFAGGLGLIAGVGLGALAGVSFSDTSEGLWSAMIIGGVTGMVVTGLGSLWQEAGWRVPAD